MSNFQTAYNRVLHAKKAAEGATLQIDHLIENRDGHLCTKDDAEDFALAFLQCAFSVIGQIMESEETEKTDDAMDKIAEAIALLK